MNNLLEILKYLVYGMIVYTLFTYVPQIKLPLSDVMVITIVVMMSYIFLDLLVPQNNIEKLDPDFAETLDEENNVEDEEKTIPTGFSDELNLLSSVDSVGLGSDENNNLDNLYEISSNQNPADKTLKIAEILVKSGLKNEEISDLVSLCRDDKNGCYNRLTQLRNDQLIDNNEFELLSEMLVGSKSSFEKIVEILDLPTEEKNEIIKLCKFNKTECIKAINLIDAITEDQKVELLIELDKLYNYEYLLKITILPDSIKKEIKEICKMDAEKCQEKLESITEIDEDRKMLILNAFKKEIDVKEGVENKLTEEESILLKLTINSNLKREVVQNLHELCSDKEKCVNRLNEMQLSGLLTDDDKILFSVFFGLNNYINISKIIKNNSLSIENIKELSYVCRKDIPISMCTIVLNKFLESQYISDDESEEILDKLRKLNEGQNIQGGDVISQMLDNGDLTTKEGSTIHKSCSLKSNQLCTQQLKQLVVMGKLTEVQSRMILKAYNKSDVIELDSKSFGSVSNISELGSRHDMGHLKNLKDAYGDSEMKYTQLDPRMHVPLGESDHTVSNNFEYGYAYLNTDKWTVPMYKPPVCKTDDNCKVCESATSGYPVDVMEWNKSRKIMPPDNINVEYINKLNEGN